MKQVFDMALRKATFNAMRFSACFAPTEAKKSERRVVTMKEGQVCFRALERRER